MLHVRKKTLKKKPEKMKTDKSETCVTDAKFDTNVTPLRQNFAK